MDDLRIIDYVSNPQAIPLRKLMELTKDLHGWSVRKVDQPNSQHHAWYYRLACECERRGLDLERIIKQ
jgi:hypothetical protein